jgi:hypothetical protein
VLLSDTGSATAVGVAAALVLATSGHVASTGRLELGGRTIVVAVLAIRALQRSRRRDRDAPDEGRAGVGRRGVRRRIRCSDGGAKARLAAQRDRTERAQSEAAEQEQGGKNHRPAPLHGFTSPGQDRVSPLPRDQERREDRE